MAPSPNPPNPPEMTVKAFFPGLFLTLIFGAANVYLGMKTGQTVAAASRRAQIAGHPPASSLLRLHLTSRKIRIVVYPSSDYHLNAIFNREVACATMEELEPNLPPRKSPGVYNY